MKNLILIPALLIVLFSTSCTNKGRSIASKQVHDNDFRVGVKELDGDNKLVLIGIANNKEGIGYNAEKIGFRPISSDLTTIDPKFMFSMNKFGIQHVYTFEFGNSSRRRLRKTMEYQDKSHYYLKFKKKDHKPKLPNLLVDVPDMILKKMPLGYTKSILNLIDYTPWSYVSDIARQVIDVIEAKKEYQASYLLRIIEMSLMEGTFNEMKEVMGEVELLRLAATLRMRFVTDDKPLTTWLITNKHKVKFYEDYLKIRQEVYSENMSKLVERANEEGLIVIPLAPDMAFLYYDVSERIDPKLYRSMLLENKKIDTYFQRYHDKIDKDRTLVPLGVFSMGDPHAPTEIIDFNRPRQNITREKFENILRLATNIGFSFIPNQYLQASLSILRSGTELILKKKGVTIFRKKLYAEAQIAALLESQTVKIDHEYIILDSIKEQLKGINIDEKIIDELISKIKDGNEDEAQVAANEVYLLFSEFQTNKRKLKKLDGHYRLVNKVIAWNRLQAFMRNDNKLKEFNEWLIKRENDNFILKRYPSNIGEDKKVPLKPAIILLVGGLDDKKLEYGLKKQILPNIKQYFIDKGMRFDVYSNQTLSLPSLATSLTGYDVDSHGLKSNTPINRYSKKPDMNYVDIRPELTKRKYFVKSRSYRHIEEVGVKWFFDQYGDKKQRYINYIPIYDGGGTPVGKYINEAFDNMRRMFFGIFSHTVTMDRASALKVAKEIDKNPGQYNLIANWYSCVQTFTKLSSHALDYCLEELDQSLGILLASAKNDPKLRNADFYLISDAGFSGGLVDVNGSEVFLDNTGFNLTKFFTGDFNSHSHMPFVVSTYQSPEPDYDLKYLQEYWIQPKKYTYRGKQKRRGEATLKLDFYGDGQAKVYIKNMDESWDPNEYSDLTQYKIKDQTINIIDELLGLRVKNLAIVNIPLRREIKDETGNHPVKWVAHSIKHDRAIGQFMEIFENSMDRFPVLLKGLKGEALILSKFEDENLLVKYVPIKKFKMESNGSIHFEQLKDDPLGIYGKPIDWISEREFLQKFKDHQYPTLLSHLSRMFNLDEMVGAFKSRRGEVPDLMLYANRGFNFNSANQTQADQGGIKRENSKVLFMMGNFDGVKISDSIKANIYQKYPLYNRDITPFILYNSNPQIRQNYWTKEWDAVLPIFDEINSKND